MEIKEHFFDLRKYPGTAIHETKSELITSQRNNVLKNCTNETKFHQITFDTKHAICQIQIIGTALDTRVIKSEGCHNA